MAELKQKRKGNYHHNGNKKHGLFNENKDLFNLWQTMKTRCENPKRENYERYGARGMIREKGIKYAEQRLSEIA